MRTTIDINEDLLREAGRLTSIKMKRKLVDTALQELVRQARLRRLAGMLGSTRLNLTQRSLRRMRSDG
ncbi:MAG: type II toxin-antitoxin system VapB family antitoxin [Candidatus Coatesbacteria bacterium]